MKKKRTMKHESASVRVKLRHQALVNSRVAMRRIKFQFSGTPEGKLMYAILNGALLDLEDKSHKDQAKYYLNGPMIHAELAGVNPTWIRETLHKCGVVL